MNFYETTYNASYARPQTTFAVQKRQIPNNSRRIITRSTGFAANNGLSPFDLAPLPSTTTTKRELPNTFHENKPIPRAAMERSGFWISENTGVSKNEKMDLNSTYQKSFPKYPTNQENFWKLNRHLIGSKEITTFTRLPVTIPERPITAMETTFQATFKAPPKRELHIPSNVSVERSGFTSAEIPTHNRSIPLSDITVNDLHNSEVKRMKRQDPVQYQNLHFHSPYMTVSQISYQDPRNAIY